MTRTISEVTRRAVFDYLTTEHVEWSGRLQEDQFLGRLYDLEAMRSDDYRYSNALGDIRQHRSNWMDWDDDWVFYDSRFLLLHGSDDHFLNFLRETVNPVVRPDTDEANALVAAYNKLLAPDGWALEVSNQISERPVFELRQAGQSVEIFEEPTGWQKVDRQLQEVRLRLDSADNEEQFQAVGLLCRETLISLVQEVFDPKRHNSLDGIEPSSVDVNRDSPDGSSQSPKKVTQ